MLPCIPAAHYLCRDGVTADSRAIHLQPDHDAPSKSADLQAFKGMSSTLQRLQAAVDSACEANGGHLTHDQFFEMVKKDEGYRWAILFSV